MRVTGGISPSTLALALLALLLPWRCTNEHCTATMTSARLLVAVALVACTASAIKHKLETQQKKPAMTREEDLIDRAAIAQIGKSKLVYHLILAGCSGAPGPHC